MMDVKVVLDIEDNTIVGVDVRFILETGVVHNWQFTPPVIRWINEYVKTMSFKLDNPEHLVNVQRVTEHLTCVNPLVIAADLEFSLYLMERLLLGQTKQHENHMGEHQVEMTMVERLKQTGKLH